MDCHWTWHIFLAFRGHLICELLSVLSVTLSVYRQCELARWERTRQAMYYNVILRCVRVTTFAVEKEHWIFCVFVTLVIKHAKRMGSIILPSATNLAVPYISKIWGGGPVENKMCLLIFSTNVSEKFLILRRNEWDIINVHRSSYKVPAIFVVL